MADSLRQIVRTWRFPALCGVGLVMIALGSVVPQWLSSHPANGQAPPAAAGPDLTPLILRFGATTAFILVVCAGTAWVIGRRARPRGVAAAGTLQVLEMLPIGGRCCVHLVKIGDQLLLAGVDAAGLKSLVPLPDDADAAAPEEPAGTQVIAGRVGLAPTRLAG